MVECSRYVLSNTETVLAEKSTETVRCVVGPGQFQFIAIRLDTMVGFIIGATRKIKVINGTSCKFRVDSGAINADCNLIARYTINNSLVGYLLSVSKTLYLL